MPFCRVVFLSILVAWLGKKSLAQKNDFLQIEVGTTLYLHNSPSYHIPSLLEFKSSTSETYSIGINYHRKISELFFVSIGTSFTNTSYSYTTKYNAKMNTDTKSWYKRRLNEGAYPAFPTLKIPLLIGLSFPLSRHIQTHRMSLSAGLSLSFLAPSSSLIDSTVITYSTYNNQLISSSERKENGIFQLFAHVRVAYYFKLPKFGCWNIFFVFEPQISKNKITTEITLLPETEHEKTIKPSIVNHNIQMGLGFSIRKRKHRRP